MTLVELLRLIGLPEEAAEGVLKAAERGMEGMEPLIAALTDPLHAERAELLHPALRELLNEKSNIVRFRALFDVQRVDNEDLSYRAFVFRRPDGNVFDYPEETALQRRLKEHLLRGGRMGAALGIRKEETS